LVLVGTVFGNVFAPMMGIPVADTTKADNLALLKRALTTMEEWLSAHKFIVDDNISIADVSLACELKQLDVLPPVVIDLDLATYPKVSAWMAEMSKLPHWEEVNAVIDAFGARRVATDDSSAPA
jgi:glutathione S-transferase